MLTLEIYSDPVCPWCYVGKSRLDAALAEAELKSVDITWKPFQLNPDMPALGMDRGAYLRRKFGGHQAAVSAYAPLIRASAEDGLGLNLELIRTMPNSLDAHRIMRWAAEDGQDVSNVADALFRAFFSDGRDIGDPGTLTDIAGDCGMDPIVTERRLRSRDGIESIMAADMRARRSGISGVPFYVVNLGTAFGGAQPRTFWQLVFRQAACRQPANHAPPGSDAIRAMSLANRSAPTSRA